jgi:cytosine/adenosine deaminase-related metal-dependent hydrolase
VILVDTRNVRFTPLAPGNAERLYSHLVFAANGSAVDTTIVDGRVLMRGRQLLTLDEAEILRQVTPPSSASWPGSDHKIRDLSCGQREGWR